MSDLSAQIKVLEKKLKKISTVEIPRASSAALNKGMQRAKSRAVKGVAKQSSLPQKPIRKKVFIKKSTAKTLKTKLSFYKTDINAVSLLGPAQINKAIPRGTNSRGVRVAGRQFNHAFVNRVRNGPQVLRRTSEYRYPLEVIKISIKKQVDDVVPKTVKRIAKSELPKLHRHELTQRLKKYGISA